MGVMVNDAAGPGFGSSPPTAPPSTPPLADPVGLSGQLMPPAPPPFGSPPRPSTADLLASLPPLPVVESPGTRGGSSSGDDERRRVLLLVAAVALAVSLLTAGLVLVVDGRGGSSSSASGTSSSAPVLDIQALLKKAQPSVVSIETGKASSTGVYGSAGSGLIISDDGLVLTNAHVVASSTTMQVALFDGRTVVADLVGSLPDRDIALVRMRDPGQVTPAELGTSADVRVGDDVVAIGNALNLGGPPSVTKGIVSATNRSIQAESSTLDNLIQTDAAINPGNSGGPLLNSRGQVVGINTAIISDAQNIGFSIAIDSIKPLIQEIKDGNATVTGDSAFLGVKTQDLSGVTADQRAQYGVQTSDGAFVVDVQAGAAAAQAGLKVGDVITAIDGQPVTSASDVIAAVRSHSAGDTITITLERGGTTTNLQVKLTSRNATGN